MSEVVERNAKRSHVLGKAILMLVEKYDEAKKLDWIHNKVAWALYQTWRYFDEREL